MAALVEGHQYGLSSENSTSSLKSVIHVKLTDSALKAIEEFQKIKAGSGRRPTIQFQGSNGVIKVPIARTSDNPDGASTFHFSLSPIPLDPKGSFECIKQNDGKQSDDRDLDLLGSMLHKVSIRATDDSYKTTRERMTQAEEESKKQRAKEIKPSGPGVGRRVKKVIRNAAPLPPPAPPSSHGPHQAAPFSFKTSAPPVRPPQQREEAPRPSRPTTLPNLHKSGPTTVPNHHKSGPTTTPNLNKSGPTTAPNLNKSGPTTAPNLNKSGPTTAPNLNKSGPTTAPNLNKSGPTTAPNLNKSGPTAAPPAQKAGPTGNVQKSGLSSNSNTANRASGVINMPLRERILHILAIRPYKKPELMMRLQKDGMKDRDKNALGAVLNQVGNFNPRDNNYTLARHLFPEVRNDWAYYTETDRQLLKRKVNQLHETALSTTSPAVSPCHSTGSQGSPNSSQKRMICDDKTSDQPPKKQRVAHSNQKEAGEVTKTSQAPSSISGSQTSLVSPVSPESPGTGNQENSMVDSVDTKPDYTRKYRKIGSADQRQSYKTDFNTEYEEYRQLHALIEGVTKKFVQLKNQLQKQTKDTLDYKNIRKRIMCEYLLVKDDTKYVQQRQRHGYLHHKLGHIKKLISDFDQARLASS